MSGTEDAGGSPPCFLHELDPTYSGVTDAQTARDVARWRKAERSRLIEARMALSQAERAAFGERIAATLDALLPDPKGLTVSTYWPFRGEPDLRPWMGAVIDRGGACALPVVVEKAAPLIFRPWSPGCAMTRGVWNIPIPEAGPEIVPDVVIAPVVGFDPEGYRLGYGGGFYDRTLAKIGPRRVIGVGYAGQAIPTIFPQPHDVPMGEIVTEAGRVFP